MSSGAGEKLPPAAYHRDPHRTGPGGAGARSSARKVKGQQKGGHSQTELPPLELISLMTGPGADVIPGEASGTETLGEKLRAQLRNPLAEEALLWRARHTQQSTAPTPSTPKGGPDSTPRRAVTWDRYEALQMPFQRTHSIHSSQKEHILHGAMLIHTTTTEGIRPGGLKEISQSATQAGAHHDSRSRPGWSSTPGARDGGHKDEYCGTHNSEDPDDSAPPQREEICTRQLEPLKKKTFIASTQTTEGSTKTTPWFWQFKSN
ncbi:unnamed protein product [Pleuronectes platessa]|uniref:Uncharacterized protein n=1 Tax=Pleuronectes platessa TaxID=8262 RepID=A0A9N7UYT6_PLEPL|nr:unnamed protein product [Pleuronectes platessa]